MDTGYPYKNIVMDLSKSALNHSIIVDYTQEELLSILSQLEECKRENNRLMLELNRYKQEFEATKKEMLELKAQLFDYQRALNYSKPNSYKVVLCEGILPSDVNDSLHLETDIRKLTFAVDKSANITGIGIFGVRSHPFSFNVLTKLVVINDTKLLLIQNDRIVCDGSPTVYPVKFHQPVSVKPNRSYELTILVNNMKTHYGAKLRDVVSVPIDKKQHITFLIDQQAYHGKEQIQCIYFTV